MRSLFDKVKEIIKENFLLSILILVAVVLCYVNYTPNTFLTGWDTLHPEFNLNIYWKRILDSVWQPHQGLGAVGSQAHASEIPRIIIITILSLFFKMSQLRYAYAFLMLIAGPVGVFFFLRRTILKNYTNKQKNLGAFAGGLLYLLNLGTLQHYYVPLEMFLTHYGLLGWALLYASEFFEKGDRKTLLWFLFFSFLITPQAHTATLFYAFIFIFTAYLFCLFLAYFFGKLLSFKEAFRRLFIILLTTLTINSFWLLPNMYFALVHGEEINHSKIHHLFSEEAFLANKKFGDISDVAILRNFLFKWGEHVGNAQFGDLLGEWIDHLNKGFSIYVGYGAFGIILLGLFFSLLVRSKYSLAVFSIFAISIFFLFNVNPPFGVIFIFFQNHVPLFKEAFRFPFTKFSISLMFSYGVFFGFFFCHISYLFSKLVKSEFVFDIFHGLLSLTVLSTLIYYMLPAFTGHLISPSMRVTIPDRYQEMFSYFDSQKEYGRVANLPIHSFWGWVYHNWNSQNKLGYQGAGFLWFGIKQPLMDREFDRWNILNEQYYREMSQAVYSENVSQFESVLEKFKIRWILLDQSILAPGSDQKEMFYPQIKKLLARSTKISLDKDFGSGLQVYKFYPNKQYTLLESTNTFYQIGNKDYVNNKENFDYIYATKGTYIENSSPVYPFVGVTNYDETIYSNYISSDENSITLHPRVVKPNALSTDDFKGVFPFDVYYVDGSLKLSVPFFSGQEQVISLYSSYKGDEDLVISLNDQFIILPKSTPNNELLGKVQLDVSKPIKMFVYKQGEKAIEYADFPFVLETCSGSEANSSYTLEELEKGFSLSAKNIKGCVTVNLAKIVPQFKAGEVIAVNYTSDISSKPEVCIFNDQLGLCENSSTGLYGNKLTTYSLITAPLNSYYIRFYSDARDSSSEHTVTYDNLQLSVLVPLVQKSVSFTLDPNKPITLLDSKDLVISKDNSLVIQPGKDIGNPRYCDDSARELEEIDYSVKNNGVKYSSEETALCDSFLIPTALHSSGYILEIGAKNVSGSSLRICLTNEYSKRCDVYVSLPEVSDDKHYFYLVPPLDDGRGYTVNISNLVFGDEKSVNELNYIALIPIPYETIQTMHYDFSKLENTSQSLAVYNQAYEAGWRAFCGLSICNAKHVMVNGWANGWLFNSASVPTNIRVIFVPQTLQYIGFILFFLTFLSSSLYYGKKR